MSRWSLDPPDDDAYDVRYDGTACEDCGRPSVAWLCETCSDQRAYWAATTEARIATARLTAIGISMVSAALENPANKSRQVLQAETNVRAVNDLAKHDRSVWSVDVALVPMQTGVHPAIVEVALVPIEASVRVLSSDDARELKRMARAFLAADLTNVKDVA